MIKDDLNSADYRRALGAFATGVAIVTTCDGDGNKVGITVNSFNSVSLDPPLVLWSIASDAMRYNAFMDTQYFAVNILAKDQIDLCRQFSARTKDRFEGLDCRDGLEMLPILPGCSAVFECCTENRFAGGDHKIIVGRVLRFEDFDADPLIFYRGHFLE